MSSQARDSILLHNKCFICDVHYVVKVDSYELIDHPVPDLVFLCCYNKLLSSGKAFHEMMEHGCWSQEH